MTTRLRLALAAFALMKHFSNFCNLINDFNVLYCVSCSGHWTALITCNKV